MLRRVTIFSLFLLPAVLGSACYNGAAASVFHQAIELGGGPGEAQPTACATPAICAGTIPCPPLFKAQNPLNHGAFGDGLHDDTAAVQAAINSGDVCFPAGKTFLINSPPLNIGASGKHLQCESGAVIKNTNYVTGGHILNIKGPASGSGSSITADSVIGCDFEGGNTEPPGYTNGSAGNIAIWIGGVVSYALIAGNTFNRWWGQAAVEIYGGEVCGGKANVVQYNTFKNCGLYGPVIDAGRDNTFAHNKMIDCSDGVENDTAVQCSGGNVIDDETVSCVNGQGYKSPGLCVYLTGGSAAGADYSGNTVMHSSVSGISPRGLPSALYKSASGGWRYKARYVNNSCTKGCQVR